MATSLSIFSSISQHSLHCQSASIISPSFFPLFLSSNPYFLSPRATTPSPSAPNHKMASTPFPPTTTSTSSPSVQAATGSEPLTWPPTMALLSPSASFLSPLSPPKPSEVRVADPTFLGYFIDKGVATTAKVVLKAYPQEKVGVFVRRGKGGPLTVVEYSELDQSLASAVNQATGRLRFCWSNVCLHMFTLDFLNQVANGLEKDSIYHLAEKKIPSIHGYTMGLKLEQFIFDAFPYAPTTALFEVLREEEFAPVKNANGSNVDTPDSAKLLVLRLHTRWVVAAGGFLTHSVPLYATGVEVSPLCSYAGENLEPICRGRTFHAPCEISF